jgi:hypothetical protein
MNTQLFLICLGLYLTLIVIFYVFNRTSKGIHNPYLNLIKPLVPSWKFYDDYEETTMLFYRTKPDDEWKQIYRARRSSLETLFVNPQGNLILAVHSHIQQLLHDINHFEGQSFQETLSYKITKNIVNVIAEKNSFQFKLAVVTAEGAPKEDVLISPWYEGEL